MKKLVRAHRLIMRFERLFYISVSQFIAVYFTVSAIKTTNIIHSVLFTFLAIFLYMFSTKLAIKVILNHIARRYFYEDRSK